MADRSGRHSQRHQRARQHSGTSHASRASSHSSTAFRDDGRHHHPVPSVPSVPPAPAAPSSAASSVHPLRTASSRFSLNEQFASTRQEYSLWDDDASSIYEQATNASEIESGVIVEDESSSDSTDDESSTADDASAHEPVELVADAGDEEQPDWDYYDILCLPRGDDLSQEQIRRAYYRLFFLFHPDSYPEHLKPIARQYFLLAQEAFEALIDPTRRARYDVTQLVEDVEFVGTSSYDAALQRTAWERIQQSIQTSSDLCLRLDASEVRPRRATTTTAGGGAGGGGGGGGGSTWQLGGSLRPLGYVFSQSFAVDFPSIRRAIQPKVSRLESLAIASKGNGEVSQPFLEISAPVLAVSGSVYGVTNGLTRIPNLLLNDPYQPLLPSGISRLRLAQLVKNQLAPLLSLKLHQEVRNRSYSPSKSGLQWCKSIVELETDVLPESSLSGRLYHHVKLPQAVAPSVVEGHVNYSRYDQRPAFKLGLHHKIHHGTAYARVEDGEWLTASGLLTSGLQKSTSTKSPSSAAILAPLGTASFELGFKTSSPEQAPASSFGELSTEQFGIRGLDQELNTCTHGSWTVSASGTAESVAGYLRFSKDLSLSSLSSSSTPSSARLEVELCSSILHERHLALRNLWCIGRFSRMGVELGVSPQSLHLSIYWSRLGQRFSLPLLISTEVVSSLFCVAAAPFAGLAAVQLFNQWRRSRRPKVMAANAIKPLSIARQRYEASNLTVLLTHPVEAQQKHQASTGGLVILSALFGVPNKHGHLSGENVANVTIALAALVIDSSFDVSMKGTESCSEKSGSRVVIPQGVRKDRLPGFWDPAPGKEKMLRVVYMWKGKESMAEARGREELVLPA